MDILMDQQHEVEQHGSLTSENISPDSGLAPIKPEYILQNYERTLVVECLSDKDKEFLEDEASPYKKQKFSNRAKKLVGQNKSRPAPYKHNPETELCSMLVDVTEYEELPKCSFSICKCIHSIPEYLKLKPSNIGSSCYIFSLRGRCPRGITCRFSAEHTTEEGRNIVNKEKWEEYQNEPPSYVNFLSKDIQCSLRKKKYNFEKSEIVLKKYPKQNNKNVQKRENNKAKEEEQQEKSSEPGTNGHEKQSGCVTDEDVIKTRPEERKKLDWRGQLYLAPLTTVGNLPFRRVCRARGADVTCSEMALAVSLLRGAPQEWALVRRHRSEERNFGVQLCGSNPGVLTRCAQLLADTTSVDFVDLNVGCPIDHLYQQGAGSGLLRRSSMFEAVVRCMSDVLSPLPLTVKLRTGLYYGKNVAHNYIPHLGSWGASLITLHGRSREQRYTKAADWAYVEECAKLAEPTPFFGNGDVLSFEDYERLLSSSPSVSGIMIGRGALIKPWLFTEIKERRHWDISSSERFDILKDYVNFGLEHWGSDTKGVENTRRFLLEWLSFLHRYIPVGLLETLPQRMNQRPPYYKGRDDLETLMASPSCADWIRISEMLLGPVPEGFHFLPKHKASSWK